MSYYDDDFYREPSEFEQQVDDFKTSLMNAIRDEYKAEMERLRTENEKLQEIKSRMKDIESERNREKHELELTKAEAMKETKKMRLSELLKDFRHIIYKPNCDYINGPKCDKCDEERNISYISPMGRPQKEKCLCAKKTPFYSLKEVESWSLEHRSADDKVQVNYYDEERDNVIRLHHIHEPGTDFNENTKYRYFTDKDECQRACDWLNMQEDPHRGVYLP